MMLGTESRREDEEEGKGNTTLDTRKTKNEGNDAKGEGK